jgi:hypothetical protein
MDEGVAGEEMDLTGGVAQACNFGGNDTVRLLLSKPMMVDLSPVKSING